MKKVEELCIKYLMNETDPSETADIRAEMIEDPDALIEYESMRSTWSKVQELPEIAPPAHLIDSIVTQAGQAGRFNALGSMSTSMKWAAAAAIVVMAGFGIYTSVVVTQNVTANSQPSATTVSDNGAHWVDRNNILYIQPPNAGPVANQTDVYQYVNKLKPVTPTPQEQVNNTEIQLAGSKKPVNQ